MHQVVLGGSVTGVDHGDGPRSLAVRWCGQPLARVAARYARRGGDRAAFGAAVPQEELCCPGRADEQRVCMPSGSATLRRLGGVGLGTLWSAGVVGVVKAAGEGGGRGLGPTSERQSPPLRVVFRDPLRPTPVG
jgi:hypothetical protein